MQEHCHIYCLCDPQTGKVHYVGSARYPIRRLVGHCTDTRMPLSRKWIDSLIGRGWYPMLRILETIPAECRRDAERRWVEKMHADGQPLLNRSLVPKVTREALAEMVRLRWSSKEMAETLGIDRATFAAHARRYGYEKAELIRRIGEGKR